MFCLVEGIELAIDKPAGAYIAVFPEELYAPGTMFIVDIENADHLTGVQVDGVDYLFLHVTIALLLTMSEDRATQRCDPSAGMEVSGGSDAACITLF